MMAPPDKGDGHQEPATPPRRAQGEGYRGAFTVYRALVGQSSAQLKSPRPCKLKTDHGLDALRTGRIQGQQRRSPGGAVRSIEQTAKLETGE